MKSPRTDRATTTRRVGLGFATVVLVLTVAVGPACHKEAPDVWHRVATGPTGSSPDGAAIVPNPDGGTWYERTYSITVPPGTAPGSGFIAGVFVIKDSGDGGGGVSGDGGLPATIVGMTINNGDIGQDGGTVPLGPETDARVQQTLIGALGVTSLDQAVFYRTVVPVDYVANQVFTINAIVSHEFAGVMLGAGGIESSLAAGNPPPSMQQFSDDPAPAGSPAPAAPVWALASLGLALVASVRALFPALAPGETIARVTESPFRRHLVWLLVVFAYIYPFPYFPKLDNPNENVRIWATRALVEFHEFDLRRVEAEWGPVDDAAWATRSRRVSSKAPGATLLGVPFYAAEVTLYRVLGLPPPTQAMTTRVLRVGGVALPMAAFLLFFARWAEHATRSARGRDVLVLGLGLGTPMYPYGLIFAGHVHGAALGFVSFALLAASTGADERREDRALTVAGLSAGLAVAFEYQLAIVLAILGIWTLGRHGRRAQWFLRGALPPILLLALYHTLLFGRPWAFPYGHLANPTYAANDHSRGFFGLALPSLYALGELLGSVRRGLFVFAPFLGFGIWGALRALRGADRGPAAVVLGAIAAMFAFQAGMSNWAAGWSVGPRYIVVVVPLLAGAAAWCWRGTPETRLLPPLGGLAGASVFLCGISGVMFPHYPEVYGNPVFDLALPLLRSGHAPYSVGRLLGLVGAWSLAPLALVVALAFALSVGGWPLPRIAVARRSVATLVLAAAVSGAYLLVVSLCFRHVGDERATNDLVESVWEPRP